MSGLIPDGRYTASPVRSSGTVIDHRWMVWRTDSYPPAAVFVGSMEDAGLVADGLNTKGSVPLWRTQK